MHNTIPNATVNSTEFYDSMIVLKVLESNAFQTYEAFKEEKVMQNLNAITSIRIALA